jgi:hypothetical protein
MGNNENAASQNGGPLPQHAQHAQHAQAVNLNPYPGTASDLQGLVPSADPRPAHGGGVRAVHMTIVIVLLALILVVNIAALASQFLMPGSVSFPQGGGGISRSFNPDTAPSFGTES